MLKIHSALVEVSDLEKEVNDLKAENDLMRQELWRNHGHPSKGLFGADGDMKCALCPKGFQDWKRTSIKDLLLARHQQREEEIYADYLRGLEAAGLKVPEKITS